MHARRRALLKQAIGEGLGGDAKPSERARPRGMEPLRPGRLLTCLAAMEAELARQGQPQHAATLQRLGAIRMAALEALQERAFGRVSGD